MPNISQLIIDFIETQFEKEKHHQPPYQGVDLQNIFDYLAKNQINLTESRLAERLKMLVQNKAIKYTLPNSPERLIAYTSIKASEPEVSKF